MSGFANIKIDIIEFIEKIVHIQRPISAANIRAATIIQDTYESKLINILIYNKNIHIQKPVGNS